MTREYDGIVASSRVRLARNFSNYNFPSALNEGEEVLAITKGMFELLSSLYDFEFMKMKNLTNLQMLTLVEKKLISNELIKNKAIASLAFSEKDGLSIMINEEDHIREQCILPGLALQEAYERVNYLDDNILENFDILYSEKLGFITASPTNLGTGMRASVMMFLPALTMFGKLPILEKSAQQLGLTVRGKYGENSKAQAFMYQISNEATMGQTEEEILQNVINVTLKICEMEKDFLNQLMQSQKEETTDLVKRALGICLNAHMLSYEEAIKYLSRVKLGFNLGIIKLKEKNVIDQLITKVHPAFIMELSAKDMSQKERAIARAKLVSATLEEDVVLQD